MSILRSVTDYSRTERVVLLVDLTGQTNPNIKTLISAVQTLTSFPPLVSSLFSYKLFFSSLSPLLSSSKLPASASSLSFDLPSSTLLSLSRALSQVECPSSDPSPARACHVAASLRQLLFDYSWDPGTLSPPLRVSSNLVLLFSAAPKSVASLSEFLDVGPGNDFASRLSACLGGLKDAFVSRDIHLAWVDMGSENEGLDQGFGVFDAAIRGLGWGYCSVDSIVLGSTLVPFGLIYPSIGVSPDFFACSDKGFPVQLNLEISDVDGQPLECKCSDLELVQLHLRCTDSIGDLLDGFKDGAASAKLCVKAVWMSQKQVELGCSFSKPILVREPLRVSEADVRAGGFEFFEERVLDMLGVDRGNSASRRTIPVWQILLSFLYRENCHGLVSLSCGNSKMLTAVLKPFTISSALLSIIGDDTCQEEIMRAVGAETVEFMTAMNSDLNQSHGVSGLQYVPCMPAMCAEVGTGQKKRNKKNLEMVKDITWNVFCNLALEQFQMDLEVIYFGRDCYTSKRLKFLKCWMKQTRKSSNGAFGIPARAKQNEDVPEHIDEDNRLIRLSQRSEQLVRSCASATDDCPTGASRIEDEAALDFCGQTAENFFAGLPEKVQQGLEFQEVNLGSLAERLVKSCTYWLYQKHENELIMDSQAHVADNASATDVALELLKVLLKDPKDLRTMSRTGDTSSGAAAACSPTVSLENILRQYELQILFRMEILQSEVGTIIGEAMTQKFVKQICTLLETIQCHHKGGFFGDWSLEKYVDKMIKSRYCNSIGEVVQRIYAKMDLLMFSDADEPPDTFLDSEESIHSQKERNGGDEMGENDRCNGLVSAEGMYFQAVQPDGHTSLGTNLKEHACKLIEAKERRRRAQRFASFTTWVPDLRRVWAPKQTKAVKISSVSSKKRQKRKEQRSSHDVVLETPVAGSKRSCRESSSHYDKENEG